MDTYDRSSELSKKFIEKSAVFHKSCIADYNIQKLLRKQKPHESFDLHPTENVASDVEDDPSMNLPKRVTRKNLNVRNFQTCSCFFCDEEDDKINLHQCQTISTSQRVHKIAVGLGDTQLIAKLSEGDMIATEAKYHDKCLVRLYNRYRNANKSSTGDDNIDLLEGM